MNFDSLRRSVWTLPILLGIGCFSALLLALVAEGVWDVLSWVVLALPLVVVLAACVRKPTGQRSAGQK